MNFQTQFSTEKDCLEYLSILKWEAGFECKKCKHTHYYKGIKELDRQCTKCNYLEPPTCVNIVSSCEIFFIKGVLNGFYQHNKKGITRTELSRKLDLKQKGCWLFKSKVMKAMESSGNFLWEGFVEVDETFVGGSDESSRGRKKGTNTISSLNFPLSFSTFSMI